LDDFVFLCWGVALLFVGGGGGSSGFFFSEDNVTANFSISNFQAVSFRLAANTGKLLSQAPPSAVEGNERLKERGGGRGKSG